MRCIAVVTTFNRPDQARRSIGALLNQTRPPELIILVENTDAPDLANAFPPHQVEAHCTGSNTGAAGGFAFGGEIAVQRGATHVMYVDDDCILDSKATEALMARAASLEHTALGAVIVSEDGNFVWELFGPDGTQYNTPSDLADTLIPTRAFAFHAILVPTEDLQVAGQPRTDLFFGGVDLEFSLRLAANGVSLFYVPGARAIHHEAEYHRFWFLGPRKVASGTPGHRYYVLRNRLLMWRLYHRDSFMVGVGVVVLRELSAIAFSGQRLHRLGLLTRAFKEGMFGNPHRIMPKDVPLRA